MKIYQLKPTTPTRIQMMSYIFVTDEQEIAVMDGGNWEDGPYLYQALKELAGKGDIVVKAWLFTHAHSDHVDAFRYLMAHHADQISLGQVYYAFAPQDYIERYESDSAHTGTEMMEVMGNLGSGTCTQVVAGQRIAVGNLNFTVLQVPDAEPVVNVDNNASVVYRMAYKEHSVLFLADLGVEGGKRLLETHGEGLQSTVVQMAHHGQNGVERDVYAAVRPKLCLWPTPDWLWDNNPGSGYNTGIWKTLQVRKWMGELGDPPGLVAKDGDWMLTLEGNDLRGELYRRMKMC